MSRLITVLAIACTASAADPSPVTYAQLHEALTKAQGEANGGFSLHMWATVVDRDGTVVAVAHSGPDRGAQWPGSRVISAQKANTANAFSLPGLALSTANLFSAVQPGGSLYGLQFSNPVDPAVAYRGDGATFGTPSDPMLGGRIGGVNVFGGGLALYAADGRTVGGLGVSGDSSTADHNIAWKVRDYLGLDYVPAGVSPTKDDNIVYDITAGVSASGWGHPRTTEQAEAVAKDLPKTHPLSRR
ncbi:MAG: heme-binding protein [Planctomycetes bacterium]|nr:heme-binding protein [Planctomycetota bacterium]